MLIRAKNYISFNNRKRKYELFINKLRPNPKMLILDVGPNDIEYSPFDNYLEKVYPYPENITALGMGPLDELKSNYPYIKVVSYNGKLFPFKDQAFDIIWSNAVLEHVGDRHEQIFFLQEIRRCGKRAFLTTPNRYFPFELHTSIPLLHWFPKNFFDRLLKAMGKSWATGSYMNLLSYRDVNNILLRAGIHDFMINSNYIGPFIMDFIIIF
jgi:SAM-dependent methyltransferase